MIRKTLVSFNIIAPLITFLLIYGVIFDGLTFGQGLGDVFYVGLFGLISIIIVLTSVIFRKKIKIKYITLIWIAFVVVLILSLTLLRGGEYRWNGNIFIRN